MSLLVYIIRHGQTAENRRGIIQGQLDTQLDAIGRLEQAPAVAKALKDVPFAICFTSDLIRAADTAKEILNFHPGVELRKLALLRERDMGNLQGVAALPRSSRPAPDHTMESSPAFMERTLRFWDELILSRINTSTENSPSLSPVVVVSHGAFIKCLALSLVSRGDIVMAPEVEISWCPNVSITLIEVRPDGTGTMLSFGDISLPIPTVKLNADELPA